MIGLRHATHLDRYYMKTVKDRLTVRVRKIGANYPDCNRLLLKQLSLKSLRSYSLIEVTCHVKKKLSAIRVRIIPVGEEKTRKLPQSPRLLLPQLPQPEPISIEDFLPILYASEITLELIDGQIVPFAGGAIVHRLICNRIVHALSSAAKPGYEVFASDIAVQCADQRTYVFPDASYTCETLDPHADGLVAPTLIVEVISPHSVKRDQGDKLDSYQAIPSVQEYVIVDSRRIWACIYRRSDHIWIHTLYGLDDTIELFSIGRTRIKMAELYAGTAYLGACRAPAHARSDCHV